MLPLAGGIYLDLGVESDSYRKPGYATPEVLKQTALIMIFQNKKVFTSCKSRKFCRFDRHMAFPRVFALQNVAAKVMSFAKTFAHRHENGHGSPKLP